MTAREGQVRSDCGEEIGGEFVQDAHGEKLGQPGMHGVQSSAIPRQDRGSAQCLALSREGLFRR